MVTQSDICPFPGEKLLASLIKPSPPKRKHGVFIIFKEQSEEIGYLMYLIFLSIVELPMCNNRSDTNWHLISRQVKQSLRT